MNDPLRIPKVFVDMIDQVFEIERKSTMLKEANTIGRNVNKLKELFESVFSTDIEQNTGLLYHNPIGEVYSETRTDLEASIAGDSTENLVITEVIKPIVRYKQGGLNVIARKGVVVAQSKA